MDPQLLHSVSMIPGMVGSLCQVYIMYPENRFLAPSAYFILCLVSFIYHYKNYIECKKNYKWLRYDLLTQLGACIATINFNYFGSYGVLNVLILGVVSSHLDLYNKKQRIMAYLINGICSVLTAGHVINIYMHWFASYIIFSINIIVPNPVTHTIFHLYSHYNMWQVCNYAIFK